MKKLKFSGIDLSAVKVLNQDEQKKVTGGSGYSGTWRCSFGGTFFTQQECIAKCKTIITSGGQTNSQQGTCTNR